MTTNKINTDCDWLQTREYRTVTLTPEQHAAVIATTENLRDLYKQWLEESEENWDTKRKYRNVAADMYRSQLRKAEDLLLTLHNYTPEILNYADL